MADDYTSDTQTTGTVAVGGSATGEIETAEDRDWFAVTLVADRTYRIDLEGSATDNGTLRDPFLRGIHDENGVLIAGTTDDDEGTGLNSEVTFTAPADGTYYVAAGAWGNRTGTYTLSVTDITAEITDDYAAGTGTGGTVAVGGSATGEIETSDDVDWFAVTLEADTTYRIDLEGGETGRGTLRDPLLRGIADADGVLIPRTSNDDGGSGLNSQATFTAVADGTYYVAASAWGGRTGTYTLSVTEVMDGYADDDFAAGTGTTGTVEVDGSATGDIETERDVDWFAVTLEAGTTYRIDLEGSRTRDGTLRDPFLYGIHDANGVLIPRTSNDDGGTGLNSRVKFKPEADGTYYVAVGAFWVHQGTYTLSVTATTDDYAAGTVGSGTVAVGGSARGEIETAGDVDWFAVTMGAGRIYHIHLKGSSTGDGTLFDPYLDGVHDADGVLIPGTTNDDGGAGWNSQVTFRTDEGGTYYVAASGVERRTGTYLLSVTDVTDAIADDDFAAGTGTTGTVEVGGSATGEIGYGGDRDWFAVTLEAERAYRIDLEGAATARGTLSDPHLRGIYDAHGVFIAGTTNDDGGAGWNSRVTFRVDEDGTYYVAAGAAPGTTGTYALSVTDVTAEHPDDYAAGTGTSGTVAVGGSATGDIEAPYDRDWFAVTLEADKPYRIDLEGAPTGGTLEDPYLRGVHDADGVFIAGTTNDDADGNTFNSRVTFTPGESGTYYVAAGTWGGLTGTYTLSVEEVM